VKFGVIAPSTNTSVQPEYEGMRPYGVTNHFSRIPIPDDPIENDDDFNQLMDDIRGALMDAIDRVMTCGPDRAIMGMSAETFWEGLEASKGFKANCEARAGVPVAMGSEACRAALRRYGSIRRIAVITPDMPVGDANVRRFLEICGFEVAAIKGFKCASPMLIAHVSEKALRGNVELDDPSVEAIVQVGTNLAMARVAAMAEFWLDKPVIAINTATYWWAVRQAGIMDKVDGWGSLLVEH
jgi:maleate isomerase